MSETARLLDDMAERMFAQFLTDPLARIDATLPARLSEAAQEAGLALALVPEAEGGLGATLEEAAVIAWRAGYHAAPLPIVGLLLAPTLPIEGECALAAPDSKLAEGPGNRIALVTDAGITLHRAEIAVRTLDGQPWLRAEGPAEQSVAAPGVAARLRVQGACLASAAMLGATHRIGEITIDYANTRKQFGRALSAFQAIQHRIAEAASEDLVAQAAVAGAIQAADGGWLRPILWQSAKVQAGRAATVMTATAHQVMGAIGFTEEHVLHHYSKKLWVWRDSWGRQAALEAEIGAAAVADPQGLWSHIVDSHGTAA